MKPCIKCGYKFTAHETADGQTEFSPGDISICIKCGFISEFTKTGLKELDVESLDPETRSEVKRMESAWVRAQPLIKLKEKGNNPPKETTYSNKLVLKWHNRQNLLTIPLDPNTNFAIITTAQGFKELHVYYSHIKED